MEKYLIKLVYQHRQSIKDSLPAHLYKVQLKPDSLRVIWYAKTPDRSASLTLVNGKLWQFKCSNFLLGNDDIVTLKSYLNQIMRDSGLRYVKYRADEAVHLSN